MSERKYIPGRGPIGAKLMILSDCPSSADTAAGLAMVGPPGRELDFLLKDSGIHRDNCWISNVSKYEVTPNRRGNKPIPFHVRAKNDGIDMDEQLHDLQEEISAIKPNCILALGGAALWALSGKTKIEPYRGSILHGMGSKFVATYHPANLLNNTDNRSEFIGYWNRQIIICDFKRAKKQSEFPELRLPIRHLQICHSSYDLVEFINKWRARGKTRMSVDIEANGTCVPVCIGIAFDRTHGMTVPLWNEGGISTIPTSDLIQIWLILSKILIEFDIIGQNFNYDRDKIKRLGFTIRKLVSDVMLKAHAINPELPKGLAFNTSIFTEEPYYKDEGMYQGSTHDLFIGCARDACVTIELDEVMEPDLVEVGMKNFFEKFLMKLPDFYWDIERQGFNVDITERDLLLRKYISWDERIRHELFTIVGTEVNVNSPKQIKSLLFENFKLPPKASTGEEDLTALLNSPTAIKKEEHRRVCELILEGRRVRKSISTYLMALPDYDGRMRTTYFPCLDTGRSSTGQQDPPIRPTIEVRDESNKKKNRVLGTAFQTMTKHGDIGADIRGMYITDISHIEFINHLPVTIDEPESFVQADSSQAEARVVWLLADDEEALTLVDTIDYHALTASWFFGGTESDYSKKVLGYEHPIRFAGKTLRHAGHLGAGKRRASISVNTDARKYKIPIQISEAVAERALKVFHTKQPKIQQVFQSGVVEALKKNRSLIAPTPFGMDLDIGGRRMFFERWGEELFRQAFSYIPQRAVTDNTKAAGIRIKERIPGIKIVMEAHDSLLFSIPDSKLKEQCLIIKEEFERVIDFSRCSIRRRELVIPCEIEVGKNYRDLHKFKDMPITIVKPKPIEPPKTLQQRFQVL